MQASLWIFSMLRAALAGLAAYVTPRRTWQPLARQSLQHPFARGNAAQVRIAHPDEQLPRIRGQPGKRILELPDRPGQPANEEFDTLPRTLQRDRLVVELTGGVAVGHAFLLEQPSDQRAVVRLVVLDASEHVPRVAVAGMVVHEDHQGLGAGALGLEHAVEKVSLT